MRCSRRRVSASLQRRRDFSTAGLDVGFVGSVFLMILIHASSNATVAALRLLWEEKPPIWSETVTLVQWGAALVFVLLSIRGSKEHLDAAEKAGEGGSGSSPISGRDGWESGSAV